jgi:hypothetical protein
VIVAAPFHSFAPTINSIATTSTPVARFDVRERKWYVVASFIIN